MACIYEITNEVTKQKYIGFTTKSVEYRFRQHGYNANLGKNSYLYKSIRKYGFENFTVRELEKGDDVDYLMKVREPYYISKLKPNEKLNLTEGGQGTIGHKFTKEHRERIAKALRGRKIPTKTRKKIAQSLMGINKGVRYKINNGKRERI